MVGTFAALNHNELIQAPYLPSLPLCSKDFVWERNHKQVSGVVDESIVQEN